MMTGDHLRESALPRLVSDVVSDVADLLQKEIRLARAEISSRLSLKVRGGIWMVVAGLLGLVVFLLLVEAAVFGIAAAGIAMHWSALIVAAVLAVLAAVAYAMGRRAVVEELAPKRTIQQVKQDIAVAKERLT
jgi:membrane protein implicated in regulation of membrane protease activity